jgi:hypothetical protein
MSKNIKHKLGSVVYCALVVIMVALTLYCFIKATHSVSTNKINLNEKP